MSNLKPITVIFADDHAIVREAFVAMCSSAPKLKVVGDCGDGLAALEMIQFRMPDFAVIDLQMPKLGGLEVIRQLRQAKHPCKLVVLSMNRDERARNEKFFQKKIGRRFQANRLSARKLFVGELTRIGRGHFISR